MQKFYGGIVKHRKIILVLFIICAVFFAICKPLVSVNYEMNDYLPEDTASTVSIDMLENEFEGGIPNARVMIHNVSLPQALAYKERLLSIDGVTDVTWLDDAQDIAAPIETMDTDAVESYYKDNTALFTLTLDTGDHLTETVNEIRSVIGDENAMTGNAVSTAVATQSTVTEVSQIAVIAVIFVLIVLMLTTTSWLEPIIVLGSLGVAILINAGSNIIFGEISFVTNAAGNILQLAVSLDYSVFLLHRFAECRKQYSDPKEAMVQALCKSTSSILSSGLTTVIGFLALCLMQFRIGPDLGLALAKGIAISLITVFIFSPCLILCTYKLIDKTRHKPFMPSFKKFGKVVSRFMVPVACIFALLIVPAFLASNSNDYYYGASNIFGTETQPGADAKAVEDAFGKSDTYVLMVPKGSTATEKQLSDGLHKLENVTDIISYVDIAGPEVPTEYVDSNTLSKLVSENYSRMVISVGVDYEGEQAFSLVEQVRGIANKYYPDSYYLAGEGVSTYDLMNTITADMVKVNLIAIAAVFVVLLFAMKSISIPALLVLAIETAIWINLSIPYFNGSTIFYISYLIISSIQLGATVDYAILFTDRYKEFRQSMGKKEAIKKTVSACTVSILTSGSALTAIGFLLGMISSHGVLSQLGYFLGYGTLCSLLVVMFALPGLLYIFDGFINKTTRNANFLKESKEVSSK